MPNQWSSCAYSKCFEMVAPFDPERHVGLNGDTVEVFHGRCWKKNQRDMEAEAAKAAKGKEAPRSAVAQAV